ncbi:MAG: hypothetical protein ACD_50C00224G0002 [uncultured bacterium]|nr:MAG: hypothetical protein ACD_50C00224G0002 [uncultured bacterium]OGH12999.1 MAG: hypothetical protein A2687_01115 [Candidatus Levybacteria bacterium RIFCSPHIGHO2_01_FULL_38_26]
MRNRAEILLSNKTFPDNTADKAIQNVDRWTKTKSGLSTKESILKQNRPRSHILYVSPLVQQTTEPNTPVKQSQKVKSPETTRLAELNQILADLSQQRKNKLISRAEFNALHAPLVNELNEVTQMAGYKPLRSKIKQD